MEDGTVNDSEFTLPPKKKCRSAIQFDTVIPVLPDAICISEIPVKQVLTAELRNKKDASNLLKTLPSLPEKLEHLKRIRNCNGVLEIVIGEEAISSDHPAHQSFTLIRETSVPSLRPASNAQFVKSNAIWPCNFHPDKEIECLLSKNCGFDQAELDIVFNNTKAVINLFHSSGKQSCAIYDPNDKELVCIASSSNILNHSVMNCLNILAEMQKPMRGGRFDKTWEFGKILCERIIRDKPTDYLCTGLDIFMSHEPCIMCAMALLHSRARRLYFVHENNTNGGLKSVVKLHCLDGINHRFQVFQIQ